MLIVGGIASVPPPPGQRPPDGVGEPIATRAVTRAATRAVTWIRRWARVAWVCRASLFSVLAGALLFSTAQARDLFLDFAGIGVLKGLENPSDLIGPAKDGFVFALLVLVFWAMPAHASARLATGGESWLRSPYGLNDDAPRLAAIRAAFTAPTVWLPRLLGAACFAIPLLAALSAWRTLPIDYSASLPARARIEIGSTVGWLVLFGAAFWVYAWRRRAWLDKLFEGVAPLRPTVGAQGRGQAGPAMDAAVVAAIFIALVVMLVRADALLHFPRLRLVPLLLGVWIPAFGLLAWLSQWSRLPWIAFALAGLAGLDYLIGDDHVVDLIAAPAQTSRQVDLATAVGYWRAANGCADPSPASSCPSPIVVMASGGASRSSFFVGSALGLLLDATCVDADGRPQPQTAAATPACGREPLFARRLFALSGVSGGSVGVATFVAMLGAPPNRRAFAPPCRGEDGPASSLSFSTQHPRTWRECLQTVLAEDNLSPVIAGLGFRDVLAFVGGLDPEDWPDRGHRLEAALRETFARFTGVAAGQGLEAGLLTTAPRDDKDFWRPVLLLNSTSVEAGRRVVFSTLTSSYLAPPTAAHPRADMLRWLSDAYNFHEEVLPTALRTDCDVSLSAAMHSSARFPIVSPAGAAFVAEKDRGCAVRASASAPLFSRLVDGGYYENYGAATARDLIVALQRLELRPFALLITNDPEPPPRSEEARAIGEPPPKPDAPPRLAGSLLSAVYDALVSSRSAEGENAVALLRRRIAPYVGDEVDATRPDATRPDCLANAAADPFATEPCFAHIAVYAPTQGDIADKVRGVSMSWWLSKPVQEYLDEQIHVVSGVGKTGATLAPVNAGQRANAAALRNVCEALWPATPDSLVCVENLNDFTNHLMHQ